MGAISRSSAKTLAPGELPQAGPDPWGPGPGPVCLLGHSSSKSHGPKMALLQAHKAASVPRSRLSSLVRDLLRNLSSGLNH